MAEGGRAVGVDGWRGGWVAAATDGRTLAWSTHTDFAGVLAAYPDSTIGVDMPIGLPVSGRRRCDDEARAFLGSARSSIFWTPTRETFGHWRPGAPHRLGIGVSVQMWNLLPKVAELDALLTPQLQQRVREVHPECSFRELTGRTPASKKTAVGAGQRLAALGGWLGEIDLTLAPAGVPVDDVLDSVAAAWTALRCAAGTARVLGRPAERDAHGLLMQIAV